MPTQLRKSAVAGQFYPSDRAELTRVVGAAIGGVGKSEPAIAIIVPHAGYIYSGAVAGVTYASVPLPERVVILGVNHWGRGAPVASWESGEWETPLGRVMVDAELVAAIARQAPFVVHDPAAHDTEHSLEVQLPFLQMRAAGSPPRIAPISIASHDRGLLEELGLAVAEAVRDCGEPVLLIASTDFTHYEEAEAARRQDGFALEKIRDVDGPGLLQTVLERRISMCGVGPTVVTLIAARELYASRAELVRYSNSGDVTGDHTSVVAYAGIVIT